MFPILTIMISHYFFSLSALTNNTQCISTILIVIGSWAQTIAICCIIVINFTRRIYIEYISIPVSIAEGKQKLKQIRHLLDYPKKSRSLAKSR